MEKQFLARPLAPRAEVSASLPYRSTSNRSPATRTGFAGLLIDLEMVLEIAATVDPVDTGAVAANAFPQHFANRPQQFAGLRLGDGAGSRPRGQAGGPRGLRHGGN